MQWFALTLLPVENKTPWSKYIDATSDGAYNSVIAEKCGVDPATVGRWRTGAVDPKPRQVVAYARAYGQSPISALVAAGYLTEEEVGMPVAVPRAYALDDFSPLELAEEVVNRLALEDGYRVHTVRGEALVHGVDADGDLEPADVGGSNQNGRQHEYGIAASDDEEYKRRQEEENE